MSNQKEVQVQVGVGNQGPTKSPATLDEVLAASTAVSSGVIRLNTDCPKPWSGGVMWALFLTGWLFAPAWWVGLAGGLRCGKDGECFIKPWAANLVMTLVSAVVLILVLSIYFGRRGAQQDGEWTTLLPQGGQLQLCVCVLGALSSCNKEPMLSCQHTQHRKAIQERLLHAGCAECVAFNVSLCTIMQALLPATCMHAQHG